MSNNAHELSNRLLNALDKNYNVVDMQTVNEIISILEKFNITKELLETTRLGKHVNELRRKTTDPTLARRAKVLVKRWRDLVIPAVASPAHTGSNRSSAERQVRRLGGTPLTSPALSLSRHVVSPAVPSPRLLARPAWGGYESDSQDVILVDDDPPPAPVATPTPTIMPTPTPTTMPTPTHKPVTPPVKRTSTPDLLADEKRSKRDKKAKEERRRPKRSGHSRAGSGTEATAEAAAGWGARNGSGPERARNGWRRERHDPYAALVQRLPPAGGKKVKTTKELLEQIQSRGSGKAPSRPLSPHSPGSPHSPDVMLIEPDPSPVTVESPLRNGSGEPKPAKLEPAPEPEPEPLPPLEDEREWAECSCGEGYDPSCPAARRQPPRALHVLALHHALLPGVNGTRAPREPHRFAVRPLARPDRPDLFTSVVPLYNYSDYADDYCVKNLSRVPLCSSLPWTEFAPAPPEPPPPPSPPPLRPYPLDEPEPDAGVVVKTETEDSADDSPADPPTDPPAVERETPKIEPEMVSLPNLEPSERLKAPLLSTEEETQFGAEPRATVDVVKSFVSEPPEHRTVERTKGEDVDGRTLYALCEAAQRAVPYRYEQADTAPVVTLPIVGEGETGEEEARAVLLGALEAAAPATERDSLSRPLRAPTFAEWHECARLGELLALPYVVID